MTTCRPGRILLPKGWLFSTAGVRSIHGCQVISMAESPGAGGNGQGPSRGRPVSSGIFLWQYRRAINRELLRQQLAAVRADDAEGYARLQKYSSVGLDSRPDSVDGNSYENRLDTWRVFITVLLVLALFGLMIIIILKSINPGTATPYVSLLSGLVGIALGWMFATASQGRQQSPSGPGTPSNGRPTPAEPTASSEPTASPEPTAPTRPTRIRRPRRTAQT